MKHREKKAMRIKLLTAIKQVIKVNKAQLSDKAETTLKKSIKQIVKKTGKTRKAAPRHKSRKRLGVMREESKLLTLHKIKMDGQSIAKPDKLKNL